MNHSISEYKMIVAICRGGGIGYKGQLPWPKLSRDMRFFAEMTRSTHFPYNSAVVMGRKTWDSLPVSSKPLKYRDNFILSSFHTFTSSGFDIEDSTHPSPLAVISSAADDVTIKRQNPSVYYINNIRQLPNTDYHTVWIIGGASIYEQFIYNNIFDIDEIYITFVDEHYEADTVFPLMFQYDSIDEMLHLQQINRKLWTWSTAETVPKFISFDTDSPSFYSVQDVDRDIISELTRETDILHTKERRIPNLRFLKLKKFLFV